MTGETAWLIELTPALSPISRLMQEIGERGFPSFVRRGEGRFSQFSLFCQRMS